MLDAAFSVTFTPSFPPSAIFPDLIRRMISLAVSMKILSTLYPVFADVSINSSPFSFANRSPSAYDTTFSSSFTCSLTDFKLKSITTNTPEEIQKNGSQRLVAYNAFFNQIGDGNVVSTISLLLNFLLDALTQPFLTKHCLQQSLALWSLLCHNAHTSRVLVTLPLIQDVVVHHSTLHLASTLAPDTLRFRPLFYASLTEVLLLRAIPGDLERFCAPFATTITTLLSSPCTLQSMETLVVCLRDITGVLRACTSSYHYMTLLELL